MATTSPKFEESQTDVWRLNASVPESVDECVHSLISQRARTQPQTPAVCASSGQSITYHALDTMSDRLGELLSCTIGAGAIVALCFEKSIWTTVAMLAVLKAQRAFVFLDISQPETRLRSIVEQTQAEIILCSEECAEIAEKLLKSESELANSTGTTTRPEKNIDIYIANSSSHEKSSQNPFNPDDSTMACYVVFTSGSTGTPKGAMLSHSNICSAFKYQLQYLDFNSDSRVFDFASYSFDVSVHNMLATLVAGGCLCVPTEEERLQDPAGAMASMRVNLVNLTPSMARLIDPTRIPTLQTIIFLGETLSQAEGKKWASSGKKIRPINTYGPAECTPISTINVSTELSPDEIDVGIGVGVGMLCWVVDAGNHDHLLPPGETGELLLEGPLVGMGYLQDPEKTKDSFITSPRWLEERRPSSRLYKTGDLVQYNRDGGLRFIGRKDTQVKIHGQRVELGEIEFHVQDCFPDAVQTVVDAVLLSTDHCLVAFVHLNENDAYKGADELQMKISEPGSAFWEELSRRVPRYMVPSTLILVSKIPTTPSGKTDRKRLRQDGSRLLHQADSSVLNRKRKPTTNTEKKLQSLWATVLRRDPESLGLDDVFLAIGGDSLSAIQLVGEARREGLHLSIRELLSPEATLYEVAQSSTGSADDGFVAPFSVVQNQRSIALDEICRECMVNASEIEDVYPSTPIQEGLMALTMQSPGDYVLQMKLPLYQVTERVLKAAWEQIVQESSIFRTRMVQSKLGLLQVVLKKSQDSPHWLEGGDIREYLEADKSDAMELGKPLARFALVDGGSSSSEKSVVVTLHHALYDAWSLELILERLCHLCNVFANPMEPSESPKIQFNSFASYVQERIRDPDSGRYWKIYLENAQPFHFPATRQTEQSIDQPSSIMEYECLLKGERSRKSDATLSTSIRGALAILLSRQTLSQDVVFGATVSGRTASVPGIELIVGPTIATVPIRVRLEAPEKTTIADLLRRLQAQATEMIPFEQTGLQNIVKLGEGPLNACDFQTLLVVQPGPPQQQGLKDTLSWQIGTEQLNTYALTLDCFPQNDCTLKIQARYNPSIVDAWHLESLLEQLGWILNQLIDADLADRTLDSLNTVPPSHEKAILGWNETVPSGVNSMVHEKFQEQAFHQTHDLAIEAWDGKLSYQNLERYTDELATYLNSVGVSKGTLVPICFEKSLFAVLAMLGLLKAGAGFVPIEPSLPKGRRDLILEEIKPILVLASRDCASNFQGNSDLSVVQLEWKLLQSLPRCTNQEILRLRSGSSPVDSVAYVLFTSGTTGRPKGVVVSHYAASSSCIAHGKALGFNAASRVLQFSSYAFDACIAEIFTTLIFGGCICIPSESDRLSRLPEIISAMNVNWMFLTPAVARLIEPSAVPSVRTITIGGEKFPHSDAARWAKDDRRVVLVYGPTECCVYCSGHDLSDGIDSRYIGVPFGCVAWVVDPDNHNKLMPLGSIGELLIEGPILSNGYLKSPEKSAQSFINTPKWLLDQGRQGRLYKTGDLVQYAPTSKLDKGRLRYVGRKDTQVKIRGQRLELAEVEHHVQQSISDAKQVITEVVNPGESKSNGLLIAFVELRSHMGSSSRTAEEVTAHGDSTTATLLSLSPEETREISQRLPKYMVPELCFAVTGAMPRMVSSGKTDRKKLRELGAKLVLQHRVEIGASATEKRAPSNEVERSLHRVWVRVVNVPENAIIGIDDNFFHLGGDSILAMRLVAEARKDSLVLTVADVLRAPTITAQVKLQNMQKNSQKPMENASIAKFSLLPPHVDVQSVLSDLGVSANTEVEDLYPCSPLQEGIMALSSKNSGDYVLQNVLELPKGLRLQSFQAAWEEVVRLTPILRTRIVAHQELGLLQLVRPEKIKWVVEDKADLSRYIEDTKLCSMGLGQPLSRFALLGPREQPTYFVWTFHHSLYDGWTLPLINNLASQIYEDQLPRQMLQPFKAFIKYVEQSKGQEMDSYWAQSLKSHEASPFPALPSQIREPMANTMQERNVKSFATNSSEISISTLLRAGLAMVIGRHTGSSDTIFGAIVSGRNADVPGITDIAGPTIATVPVRIRMPAEGGSQGVAHWLKEVQQQGADMTPFEQIGLQNISRLSPDTQRACQFQTLLVIQADGEGLSASNHPALGSWQSSEDQSGFTTYALTVEYVPSSRKNESAKFRARFDARVVDSWTVERLLGQWEYVTQQLVAAVTKESSDQEFTLLDIDLLASQDREIIQRWNISSPPPAAVDRCVHAMVNEQARARPSEPAVEGWDGRFNYQELDILTSRLAEYLIDLGVGPEVFVPICFPKSTWTIVAMFGVLKAGGAFVLLDPTHPIERLRMLCEKTQARVAIASSSSTASRIDQFIEKIVIVDQSIGNSEWHQPTVASALTSPSASPPLSAAPSSSSSMELVSPTNTAYVIFTSGSTGAPKGCKIEHRSYCSTAVHHGSVQKMSTNTRALQFGSYSFAGAIMEILMTLIHGGCVCVPSEEERNPSLLSNAIQRLQANWAFLTSSVLSALHPDNIPSMETICVGGEAIQASQIAQWSDRVHLRQTYGSAETSAVVSSAHLTGNATTGDVGIPTTGRYWIVDPQNLNRLAPLGSLGEVIIEGPTIGREYLDEPQKSAAAFIKAPSWRTALFGAVQPSSRFYKTGDLGSYTNDGSIILWGRKDTQVKLRGQRIELGEVEHQVRLASDLVKEVAVEIAVPKDSVGKANTAVLVAFFVLRDQSFMTQAQQTDLISSIRDRLYRILPQYMVPSAFLALDEMPKTISKKTDRRGLRETAASYRREELFKLNEKLLDGAAKRQPSTAHERALQDILSRVLGIDKTQLGVDEDFFQVGGDSISALKIVAEARRAGMELSMSDIFTQRSIESMAHSATPSSLAEAPSEKLSLLPVNQVDDIDKLLDGFAASCAVHPSQVEDVYPCTPLQEGLFSLTLKSPGDYILQNVLEISGDVDMERFQNAWQSVVSSVSILRTRIFENNEVGLLQVVVNDPIKWNHFPGNDGLESFLVEDKAQPMDFGSPLSRFTLIDTPTTDKPQWLVWTIHHSIYDGWSLSLILDMVKKAYASQEAFFRHEFAPFVKYLQSSHAKNPMDYWRTSMNQYEPIVFPQLPPPTHKPLADRVLERNLDLSTPDGQLGVTLPVIARAALGILIGRHASSNDVLFGNVVSGRNAPVQGIENLIGPTIATVPIRVQLSAEQSVKNYIGTLQQQYVEMIPFEQTGLQNISRASPHACDFQTLLVVHPGDEHPESPSDAGSLGKWLTDANQSGFTTYALTLECYLPASKGSTMKVKATYDVSAFPEWEMGQFLDQYCVVFQQLLDPKSEKALRDIDLMTPQNRELVWKRNAKSPVLINRCIHDLIQEIINVQPNAIALSSWDGEMEYEELGVLSDQLAHELILLDGYSIGALIPLCFEKSMWTVVAMLAAMKAGLTAVTMDTTQPTERMKMIVQQMGDPPLILSSVLKSSIASVLLPGKPKVEVGPRLNNSPPKSIANLPGVSPAAPVCVVFTSGSTGVPKGAALTHSGFASGIHYQSQAFGHGPGARIFAFASYSFDISWFDTLHALASGSTLCIPSEAQRKDDLQNSLASSGVTVAFMTPSVARLLKPSAIPSLRLLALGGEPQRWADFRDWPDHVTKLSVYGPAECTVVSGAEDARKVLEPRDFTLPAHGSMGLNVWLVDPYNPKLLVPPGATGEMWLEGPLVGAGYIGDKNKTAAAFTEDPEWLLQGGGADHLPGRRGRLYKTGDTARYASDGRLWFMGRKDTQVKIRGQRVELAEVERRVQRVICDDHSESQQVVAEIITLKTEDGESNPMLVAFIEDGDNAELDGDKGSDHADLQVNLTKIAPEATNDLLRHIPSYMVPRVYISVRCIPKTVNGKTDRKLLRHIGSQLSINQLTELEATKSQPTSAAEICLQRLWAKVLSFATEKVGVQDNFFQLGGDSISAMRLVSLARAEGATYLSVAAVFNNPVLCDQAQAYFANLESNPAEDAERSTAPFSLIPSSCDRVALFRSLTHAFGITGEVQDLYPCTPLQEGLLALTSKNAGDYVMQSIMELPDSSTFNLSLFKKAWNGVVHNFDILRTRIVEHDDLGLAQLVIKQEDIHWWHSPNETLESYTARDKLVPMDFGTPLARFALIGSQENTGAPQWFVWTAHHALYDGWSLPIMIKRAGSIYRDLVNGNAPQGDFLNTGFSAFVEYVEGRKADRGVDDYWRDTLSHRGGDEAIAFPMLPASIQQRIAKRTLESFCSLALANKSVVTTSTLVRASLALLFSRQTGVPEALFGSTVSGRNAPVADIENIVGPTIATVPLRIAVPKDCRIDEFLSSVQRQATEMIPYEQTGLRKISRASEEASRSCGFQTLLVVQSVGDGAKEEEAQEDYGIWRTDASQQGFTTYSLTIECCPAEDDTGLKFCATFDERVIEPWIMERLMAQLTQLTQQLAKAPANAYLADIDSLPQEDRDLLWAWNGMVPETNNRCVHDIIHEVATERPSAQAICAWDGDFTYAQLDDASDRLAASLLLKSVTSGTIVPLCFEKSKWTVVGVLGVLKAGAAFVFLDAETQPESRLRAITEQTKYSVICSSVRHEKLSLALASEVLVVGPEHLSKTKASLPRVDPSMPLYLNFTSGSTGKPKGAIVPHKSFASALHHQLGPLNISQDTRLYDFASYSFDVAIHNVLATLSAGGCLCVPSDMDRKTRLAESMEEMRTNYVNLTASVSRLIDPQEVPTLDTLTLGGEPVTQGDAESWWGKVNLINSCGPSECTPMSVINASPQTPTALRRIGFGKGILTWIVDPLDHNQLLPVGQVGELLLEGPLLGSGYLDDPIRTNAAFIEAPRWLSAQRFGQTLVYKTGDLVQYHSDGSIHIVGRKDTQVKVRGQRVELEEVEHHLRRHLPASASVVAEAVSMKPSAALIAFVSLSSEAAMATPEVDENEITTISNIASKIVEKMSCDLPPYMIPSLYVPVKAMPMTATGKTNRKELRALASSLPRGQLELMRGLPSSEYSRRIATTPLEILLRRMFERVLHIPTDSVGLDDSFVALGGDSIAAMQLAGEARKQGLRISVADVFRELTIGNILENGSLKTDVATQGIASIEPFQLVSKSVKQGIFTTLLCHDNIQDILPTTDFQSQNTPHPCNYFYLDFQDAIIDEDHLQRSCQSVLDSYPLLRSIFVLFEEGYWQVVLGRVDVSFNVFDVETPLDEACNEFCARDISAVRVAEKAPTHFTLVRSKKSTSGPLVSRLIIRLSHAQYDGFSLPIIVQQLADHYDSCKELRSLSSADSSFAAYLARSIRSRSESRAHWSKYLSGSRNTPITSSLSCNQESLLSTGDGFHKLQAEGVVAIPPLESRNSESPPQSTVLASAWAILLSIFTAREDVIFGHLVANREDFAFGDNSNIVGPSVTIAPVRVNVKIPPREDANASDVLKMSRDIRNHLLSLQSTGTMMGCDDILRSCTNWYDDGDGSTGNTWGAGLESLVQHQNIDENPEFDIAGVRAKLHWYENAHSVPPVPLGIVSYPVSGKDELRVRVMGSSQFLTVRAAECLVDCLVEIVKLLFAQNTDERTEVVPWHKLHDFVSERFGIS